MSELRAMRNLHLLLIISVTIMCCSEVGLKYQLYSNGKVVVEILPRDIEFYDTSNVRGYVEIHEIRLSPNFYPTDSLILISPIALTSTINGQKYFQADHFHRSQSEPSLAVNFHFDPDCENSWSFNEEDAAGVLRGDTVIINTRNDCNSIELFHRQRRMYHSRESYFEKKSFFRDFIDTARLAHEILLDPYYLNAIKASGIEIR